MSIVNQRFSGGAGGEVGEREAGGEGGHGRKLKKRMKGGGEDYCLPFQSPLNL